MHALSIRGAIRPARALAPGLLVVGLVGCGTVPVADPGSSADPQAAYSAAIADAAIVSPAKIRALLPLPSDATVVVVSWASKSELPASCAHAMPCTLKVSANRLWVTLAGEVQTTCRSWGLHGDALRRRMEQLLGLPPDPPLQVRKTKFVMLEVPRHRIERPCLGVNEADPAHPTCTLDAQITTSAELRNFVGRQMASSYVVDSPKAPGYPYTRLGYTYDWGTTEKMGKHYGASEFVLMPDTVARVTAQIVTDEYCSSQ